MTSCQFDRWKQVLTHFHHFSQDLSDLCIAMYQDWRSDTYSEYPVLPQARRFPCAWKWSPLEKKMQGNKIQKEMKHGRNIEKFNI